MPKIDWSRLRRLPPLPRRRTVLAALGGAFVLAMFAVTTEALVRARLDEPLRRAATRYYARPQVIEPGTRLDPNALSAYLARMGYHPTQRSNIAPGEYRRDGSEWTIGRRAFRVGDQLDKGGVVVIQLSDEGSVDGIEDDRGREIARIALEPESLRPPGEPGEYRIPVRLADVPQHLVDAVLAIEDRRFYKHSGLDVTRVVGSMIANLKAGRVVQGGSTISQQLAKNLFLSRQRTVTRKVRELAMAAVLEDRYTKEQILEAYLNEIYLGQEGAAAVRGVGSAAQFYFGKDVSQLDVAESAMLAGLIRGPNLYQPFQRPEAALARRNVVLAEMAEVGKLDSSVMRRAMRAPIHVKRGVALVRAGRYFADYVAAEVAARNGRGSAKGGLTVFTTLDMNRQFAAERAVANGLASVERDHPELRGGASPLQAALVALNPATGEILAMVGGRDYGATQFNRAADAMRQPGSAFKPVVALAALSSHQATLASTLSDEPLSVRSGAVEWRPVNYDGRFRGDVTLRQAIESSLNVPFARLGLQIGPERIVATARKMGITSPLRAVPSLALGSSEVTPLELARAYGVLAAQGYRAQASSVIGALDANGAVALRSEGGGERPFTAAETYLVTSALEGVVERGTGRGLRDAGYRGAVAAKTGTSSDSRDAWFAGYTPGVVVVVWVGFDDGRSTGLTGAQAALPIFSRFLLATDGERDEGAFEEPPGIDVVSVDRQTGQAAGWGCGGEPEYFLEGTAPEGGDGCWTMRIPRRVAAAGSAVTAELRALVRGLVRSLGRSRR